jgi:cellulose synthase/poly-beta-1,6-N-acetylglucosamine synthase-like glycosyltransferase
MELDLPFGPMEGALIYDNFTYEDVKTTQCLGKVCTNICTQLLEDPDPNKRYLTICVPCYNEDLDELLKTLLSLMENIEFMQRKVCQIRPKRFPNVSDIH